MLALRRLMTGRAPFRTRFLCSVTRGEDIRCTVEHGRVGLTLPLALGPTVFNVAPHTDAGGLAADIARECQDTGLVHIETWDGFRVSQSHMLGPLMKAGSFSIVIGGKKHLVTLPEDAFAGDGVDASLEHVQRLVRDLYTTLDAKRVDEMEARRCDEELAKATAELKPLNEKRDQIVKSANRRADLMTWGGLGLMTLQFGFLWELSWNIFSWDLMEPVTYFVGYGTMIFFGVYHAITRQDYTYEGYHRRQYSIGFHKRAQREGLDVEHLSALSDKVRQLQMRLDQIRK